jgi:hypothetical protein
MPNVNGPFGLRPYAMRNGAPYSGAVRTYYVPASNPTALYIGDPVVLITNSSDGNGIQTVQIATAGDSNMVLGAFQGITNNAGGAVITLQQTQPVYLPASQAAYVVVSDDPDLLYVIQEDGAAGAAMVSGASGRNANLLSGTGSIYSAQSGWTMQTSSLATTPAHQLRIIQLLQQPADNAVGQYARWLVKLNQAIHPYQNATGI